METTRFYYGRLHFRDQLTLNYDYDSDVPRPDRIEESMWEYTKAENPVYVEDEDDEIIWVFSSVERFEGYIIGKFGKIYTDQLVKFDFDEWDFVDENRSDNQAEYCFFILSLSDKLVAFNQRHRIRYRQFQEAFAEGFNAHIGIDDALTLRLLKDSTDIDRIINNSTVTSIHFQLVPTNPTNSPDMQTLDDHIQNMGADTAEFGAEADGGINMDDDLMQAALSMSAAGYGDFRMDYFNEGRDRIYESTGKPAANEAEEPNTIEGLKTKASSIIKWANELRDHE